MVDYGTSGNIYRYRLPRDSSLNAAFVNIGLEKDGFLSMADVVTTAISTSRELKRHRETRIQEILQVGDKVLVQMAKEAIGEKGPALTCKISLPGRFLVYMPYTNAVRMSRMLDDVEKRHFRELVDKKFNLEGGLIFRTAAKNKTQDDIEHDYEYLIGIWQQISKDFRIYRSPKLIHEELDLFERTLRDDFHDNIEEIIIDHPRLKHRIAGFLKTIAPKIDRDRLIKFNPRPGESVWEACNLGKDVEQLFHNYVYLKSGSYIIIEEMETLVAIDVNTGKSVAGKNVDDAIFQTNMEAAAEITVSCSADADHIDLSICGEERSGKNVLERNFKDRTLMFSVYDSTSQRGSGRKSLNV